MQAQFIELNARQFEGVRESSVETARMLAGARDPTSDSGFRHLEDAGCRLSTEAFGNGVQDLGDPGGRGSEPGEGSVTAS
jgi:hypothetical protein